MSTRTLAVCVLAALSLSACASTGNPSTTPSTSPGAAPSASPSFTPYSTRAADHPEWLDPQFCGLIAQAASFNSNYSAQTADLNTILNDQTTWTDPNSVTVMHTAGRAMLDSAATIKNYYESAAALVSDPTTSAAFMKVAELNATISEQLGQAAVSSATISDYFNTVYTILQSTEITTLVKDATPASATASQYIITTCGITPEPSPSATA